MNNEVGALLGTPEASEILLSADPRLVCETYIFEPSPAEVSLGRLYVVGEIEDRNGIGKELLDMATSALQREYYRDPTRGLTTSFESALHQANIVLHDAAEQGVKDWMGYFHMAVGVVAEASLHLSTAGKAFVFLVRKGKVTLLTEDLSYSPITDPLRTFSQVASGTLAPRDVLFLGTPGLATVFRREDLLRFSVEHSAQTISTRLIQLYADQQSTVSVAALIISILPRHIATNRPILVSDATPTARRPQRQSASLVPRQPIIIHRTALRAVVALVAQAMLASSRWLKQKAWPVFIRSSRRGGQVVASAGAAAGRNAAAVTRQGMSRWSNSPGQNWKAMGRTVAGVPLSAWDRIRGWVAQLPRTSKIFAGIAVALAIILVVSLFALQSKRADDTTIQQGSEKLHAAETKVSAAETALIYGNRDQASTLLREAGTEAQALLAQNVFLEEAQAVMANISVMQDRLQKVLRASTAQARVVGDFGSLLGEAQLGGIAYVDSRIFSFNPKTNEIFAMTDSGETSLVSETSQGIGALRLAVPHSADKNIVFITDAPGVAIFDAKDGSLNQQDISWPAEAQNIDAAAVFGSRLYLVSPASDNIYSYSKTLRGYSGRTAWVTAPQFPFETIVSLAVDGSLYSLHQDGSIQELFKGAPVAFEIEPIDPPLSGATKIVTQEDFDNLYVFDPAHQRVVIFDKKGALVQQVVVDVATQLSDMAVAEDEATLYVLDGARVLALPLGG